MRKLCCGSLAAMIGLMLAGCVQRSPAVDPVAAVAQLSTGAPLLRCRADCVAEWRRSQPDAATTRRRRALVGACRAGDHNQLPGRSDPLLSCPCRRGAGLSNGRFQLLSPEHVHLGKSLSCRHESGVCGGVVLPNAALARIAALESEARRARPHLPRQSATGAKSANAGSKPVPAGEPKPRSPSAPEREPHSRGPQRRSLRSRQFRSRSRSLPPFRLPASTGPPPPSSPIPALSRRRLSGREHPHRPARTRSPGNTSNPPRPADWNIGLAIGCTSRTNPGSAILWSETRVSG